VNQREIDSLTPADRAAAYCEHFHLPKTPKNLAAFTLPTDMPRTPDPEPDQGEYLDELLRPLGEGRPPARLHIRKLASGLNRIWTGLLLGDSAHEVHLATGLDLTTSPVSDIHLAQLELDSDPPGVEIVCGKAGRIPDVMLRANGREFRFSLTLPRYEFLCRVADGAMPSSFSRESCTDFMSLKQRCLRDLKLRVSARSLHLIEVHGVGTVQRFPIHLSDQ